MSETLILEFAGVSADAYWAVNKILGVDPITGDGDWPAGLIHHQAGEPADGGLVVIEVWESQAAQEAFMTSRLHDALVEGALPPPAKITWLSVLAAIAL